MLCVRLAPVLEVRPIGAVRPDGIFSIGVVNELGSPVCDCCHRASFIVGEGTERIRSVGIKKKRYFLGVYDRFDADQPIYRWRAWYAMLVTGQHSMACKLRPLT